MEQADQVPLPVIGFVRSGYAEPEHTPVQAALNRAAHAVARIAPEYRDGLAGLDGFSHAWLLTWLHRRGDSPAPLRQVPFLLRPRRRMVGIFATRGPRRVNPIGLSLVELTAVRADAVEFRGVDMIDGTPVLDIKPYVTRFDRPPGEPRCGWLDDLDIADGTTPASLEPQGPRETGRDVP